MLKGNLIKVQAAPSADRVRITNANEIVRPSNHVGSSAFGVGSAAGGGADDSGDGAVTVGALTAEDLADPAAAVHRYAQQRNDAYRAAASAFRRGMASYAGDLAQRGKALDQLMKQARLQVVQNCLQANPTSNVLAKPQLSGGLRGLIRHAPVQQVDSLQSLADQLQISRQTNIDLHGLHVPEAMALLRSVIAKITARQSQDRITLNVVTGVGHHSVRGRSRLRETVQHYLQSNGHVFSEPNDGQFRVQL